MKRLLFASLLLAVFLAAPAEATTSTTVYVTIRHQDAGCHAWAVVGGPYRATLQLRLRVGDRILVSNDDLMTHRLVQLAGPRMTMPPTMVQSTFHHPGGGTVALTFERSGSYRFRSIDGTDPDKPVATSGAENVLRLNVRVG
jgi:plastocyanin